MAKPFALYDAIRGRSSSCNRASSLPESQVSLRDYTKRFAAEAQRLHVGVVLYGVWPPKARATFFDAVTTSYARAADDVGGRVRASGGRLARRLAPQSRPTPLCRGRLPSVTDVMYVAALMFFQRITGRSPIGLPAPAASKNRVLRDSPRTPPSWASCSRQLPRRTAGGIRHVRRATCDVRRATCYRATCRLNEWTTFSRYPARIAAKRSKST